jgi:hypothetical protein
MSPLSRLSALFRGRARGEPAELEAYGEVVGPVSERLGTLYTRWRQDLELLSAEPEMANAASIQRWEAAGLLDQLQPVQPPPRLVRAHSELKSIIADTARAAQLLSNGYRFHSSRARCDGHALMLASEARFGALRKSLAASGLSIADTTDGGRAARSAAGEPAAGG